MLSTKRQPIIPVLCAVLACGFAEGCAENRDLFFSSLADATKAGESDRGWIPEYPPKTARAIHITEQLSPSKEWCGFEFLPNDSQNLRETLKRVDAFPSSVRRLPSPGATWWPAMLKGDLDVQRIHKDGFELYIVETPADSVSTWVNLFAIDWAKGRAYFYGTRE